LTFPAGLTSADWVGFGLSFQGDITLPQDCFLMLKTTGGITYRSKNLKELFQKDQLTGVVLKAGNFVVDPEHAEKNPGKKPSPNPDWATVNRMDLGCSGPLPTSSSVARIGKLYFACTRSPDGQTAAVDNPILLAVKDFATNKTVQTYGNIRVGEPPS